MKIGALEMEVEVVPGLTMLEDNRFGAYRAASQKIQISAELGRGLRLQVLLHEVLHAIAFDRAVDLKEREVDQLTNGLLAFIVDNGLI